ncbi:hypothetical protein [Murimonas intestini]|uniref:Uncharacterized protein n=1 Tax=Murimonas intestini TaxID=1337051 RepID=A0AB73SZK0_9FIRM|nr:hypothetical protein [Murimonas intestini]MCR1842791.1 hypothetical protein [Murimonas intestini]MCR1867870.1 hypothetical protein [Murimonas intestini]MCR1885221.1 hypothetical protein [Murimonas intestini]
MLKKIYQELVLIRKELQAIRKVTEPKGAKRNRSLFWGWGR